MYQFVLFKDTIKKRVAIIDIHQCILIFALSKNQFIGPSGLVVKIERIGLRRCFQFIKSAIIL